MKGMKEDYILTEVYRLNTILQIYESALLDISKFQEGLDSKLCALIAKSAVKEAYNVGNQIQKVASRR